MKTLWAPWRMAYITGLKQGGCILCEMPDEGDDRRRFILARGTHTYVVMNVFPYNSGHLMVVPYRHTDALSKMTGAETAEMMLLAQQSENALRAAFSAEGFNVGMNLGRVAGAGIVAHIHLHVVPRWDGDTNFMPVVGETKVIPQSLEDTYERLVPYFRRPAG